MTVVKPINIMLVEEVTKAIEDGIRERPFFAALFPDAATCRRAAELAADDVVRALYNELGFHRETMVPDPKSLTQFAEQQRFVSDWHPA